VDHLLYLLLGNSYCTTAVFANGVNSGIYRKKENKTPQQQLVPFAYPINREARITKPHVQGRSGCRDRGPQRVVTQLVTGDFGRVLDRCRDFVGHDEGEAGPVERCYCTNLLFIIFSNIVFELLCKLSSIWRFRTEEWDRGQTAKRKPTTLLVRATSCRRDVSLILQVRILLFRKEALPLDCTGGAPKKTGKTLGSVSKVWK
jgi:hypothetical protein